MAQIVPGLMQQTSHDISVLTNFSADHHTLHRFAALTADRLKVFSASFHIEYAQAEAFAAKAAWFVDLLAPDARFVINQVVLPGREAEAAACRDVFEAEGLRWFPQLYKRKGGVAEYDDERALRALIGDAPGQPTPTWRHRIGGACAGRAWTTWWSTKMATRGRAAQPSDTTRATWATSSMAA